MEKKLNAIKNRLLDTSKRSRLINFRKSFVSTIEFQADDISEILNALLHGKAFSFAKLFDSLRDVDLLEDELARLTDGLGKTYYYQKRYTKEEIKEIRTRYEKKDANVLFSTAHTTDLNRILDLLRRKSKLFYDETGVNPLYMTAYFFNYREDGQERQAPLILIPVSLTHNKKDNSYTLKAIDEDFAINENFIHKAKQDFGLDLRIPSFDMSLEAYRDYVKGKALAADFSVSDELWLGLFSFAKIMQYDDVINNENRIVENEIYKALSGKPSTLNNNISLEDIDLDNAEPLDEQNQVLDADSSQYKAIYYAKKGLSFVLQGPPGTGKSQTITNMLSELIAQNKRVLFVCEKKSALEVVYNNLKKCGLERYALALFDTKINKKDIIREVYHNLELVKDNRVKVSSKGADLINTLANVKRELNEYHRLLSNTKTSVGLSMSEIFEYVDGLKPSSELKYRFENLVNINHDEFNSYIENIKYFTQIFGKLQNGVASHPFYGLNQSKLTMSQVNELEVSIKEALDLCIRINSYNEWLNQNLSVEIVNTIAIDEAIEIIKAGRLVKIPKRYFSYRELESLEALANKVRNIRTEEEKALKTILNKYKTSFLDLDAEAYLHELRQRYGSFAKRLLSFSKFKAKLYPHLRDGFSVKYDDSLGDFDTLSQIQIMNKSLKELEPKLYSYFDEYNGTIESTQMILDIIKILKSYEKAMASLSFSQGIDEFNRLSMDENNIAYINNKVDEISSSLKSLRARIAQIDSYFDIKLLDEPINVAYLRLKQQYTSINSIYEYMDYLNAYNRFDFRVKQFIDEAVAKNARSDSLLSIFLDGFARAYIDKHIKETSYDFLSASYLNYMLNSYKELDDKILDIAKVRVDEMVTKSWPSLNSLMSTNYEVKTLATEANKKRKFKPIRQLFAQIPGILTDIKPIIMASPICVASYLDAEAFSFDCVIFDEASQMTLENAIGAIYRSNQVIIVGDNEQLPPTSFFDLNQEDEEDEDVTVFESLLDEGLATLPKIMLKWHYRSKDESLIAFSNQEIYHDLTTFPSVKRDTDLGLKYIYVENAIYRRGERINQAEANRLISLVFELIDKNPSLSIGVVTLNMAQQAYIERLIERFRANNPQYEEYFDELKPEPFFVKNLETVQGDERDIIILSTTFGPDERGKISMNFGPINKDGGYRRLNVAITRAKRAMYVVSSMKKEDFKSDITNRGVMMLRDYLGYARDNDLINCSSSSKLRMIESLKEYLALHGYGFKEELGSSAYRIDLAVYKKNSNSEFALAILADSKNYLSLKTSRDRNHLMDKVLQMRGWKIYHLWSFAYLMNPEAINKEILDILEEGYSQNKVEINSDDSYAESDVRSQINVDDIFTEYPDVDKIIDDMRQTNLTIDEMLQRFIVAVSPINIQELKKLVPPFFGKTRTSKAISDKVDDAIVYLTTNKGYITNIGFILSSDDLFNIRFRKKVEGKYYPTINNIFPDEIENAVMRIVERVGQTDKEALYQAINPMLGYSKTSNACRDILDRIIQSLIDFGHISINGDIIEYVG